MTDSNVPASSVTNHLSRTSRGAKGGESSIGPAAIMSLMKPVGSHVQWRQTQQRSCLLFTVNEGKCEPSQRRRKMRRSAGSRIRLQQADKHGEKREK